ncbi:uncharacterized protein LOC113211274 [Frankliniella occidentalis]|uniref:Uncharacterized protein LOC113211274 n=1 Tax=Frankliniella occidentalis TaxID=133901 RepID=A0A6J1SWX9_FRAOC|nr:uncharacterized protein LOC113211274 [Frankliniella occidentalis]
MHFMKFWFLALVLVLLGVVAHAQWDFTEHSEYRGCCSGVYCGRRCNCVDAAVCKEKGFTFSENVQKFCHGPHECIKPTVSKLPSIHRMPWNGPMGPKGPKGSKGPMIPKIPKQGPKGPMIPKQGPKGRNLFYWTHEGH